MDFKLRFGQSEIDHWASRYQYPGEDHVVDVLGPSTKRFGYFTKLACLKVCRWKSPRTKNRVAESSEVFIREVTPVALLTPSEQLRIEILTLLRGASWPTASVLLHFAHPEPYPIIDYRALWSLGVVVPDRYDFPFWWAYTQACRDLATASGVGMRMLDRALWQYSKEHQRG